MSVSIGLVGLPNAGKSTLFNAITGQSALVADYPFATIEPNRANMMLLDKRLEALTKIYDSQKQTPASIECVDVAGLIKGASQGQGLGNQFLSHIRSTNLVALVSDAFKGKDRDVVNGIQTIMTELLLSDWQTLDRHRGKLIKTAKSDPEAKHTLQAIQQALADLDQEKWLRLTEQANIYQDRLSHLNLLTLKPILHIFNVAADDISCPSKNQALARHCHDRPHLFLSAQLEAELSLLLPHEQAEFAKIYGLKRSAVHKLGEICLNMLQQQTFFTAGNKESRSWLIPKDCLAPKAAGVIHSDLQRGFIAAEIVSFEDLKSLGSWKAAKAAGKCRSEGRGYHMQPGDVVDFKFNV